jgi:hypothetical protein
VNQRGGIKIMTEEVKLEELYPIIESSFDQEYFESINSADRKEVVEIIKTMQTVEKDTNDIYGMKFFYFPYETVIKETLASGLMMFLKTSILTSIGEYFGKERDDKITPSDFLLNALKTGAIAGLRSGAASIITSGVIASILNAPIVVKFVLRLISKEKYLISHLWQMVGTITYKDSKANDIIKYYRNRYAEELGEYTLNLVKIVKFTSSMDPNSVSLYGIVVDREGESIVDVSNKIDSMSKSEIKRVGVKNMTNSEIEPIKLSLVDNKINESKFMENFSLNINSDSNFINRINTDEVFNEAVFADGKATIKPIEDGFQLLKDELNNQISKQKSDTHFKFNPTEFVRHKLWKDLEDTIGKTFGFRNIEIYHTSEIYIDKKDQFEENILNCFTYASSRYPIDGLVTDKGFYDSTRSINCQIIYTLGLIHNLSAGEITAIFLHEMGHNIDPALVSISYHDVNKLSKYITEGRTANDAPIEERKSRKSFLEIILLILSFTLPMILRWIWKQFRKLFFNPAAAIESIRNMIRKDKEKFDRINNSEAFADNITRMYGYGPQLVSAFEKITKLVWKDVRSRIKNEKERQLLYSDIIGYIINDVHKTDIHRFHSLMKEYKIDLNDPTIPEKVKKGIREDLESTKKFVDMYLNNNDEFINNVNKMILEELEKMDTKEIDKGKIRSLIGSQNIKNEIKKFDFIDRRLGESVELLEEKKKENKKIPLSKEDYEEIKRCFGNKHECSFAKDEDGYYVHTHRARSKSYPSIDKISKKDYNFISSTS